jgi:SWI/SNF-related matrix-associated actin-dependent regulator 1 of chromatin subfamily A
MAKTYHYIINNGFARRNDIPTSFVGIILKETERAVYMYGRGEVDPEGSCCKCGRVLTHPGSIILGIGPDCLGDWNIRDITLDNITEAQKAFVQARVRIKKVDTWMPKRVIKETRSTDQVVKAPKKHEILMRPRLKIKKVEKQAVVEGHHFKVTFPYDSETVRQVKSIPGRRWNVEGKYWTVPIQIEAATMLREFNFPILGLDDNTFERFFGDPMNIKELDEMFVPGLKRDLYPFQARGVTFIESNNGRALIADEMGLGKTVQAAAWLQLHPEARPTLIVCPASLKLNWKYELRRWLPKPKTEVLEGRQPYEVSGEILIINYDVLNYWAPYLKKLGLNTVITDEAHYYKNNGSNRTKAVKKIAKDVPHFMALSGTPIVNKPIEIYNAVSLIDDTILPNWFEFGKKYCDGKHDGFGWDMNGASNTQELHQLLVDTIMIRRKKADVLEDLPDKTRAFVPFDLDNQSEYNKASSSFLEWVKATKGKEAVTSARAAETLAQIEALRQIAVRGKMKMAIEWVRDVISSGEKLVLFGIHKFVIDEIMNAFPGISVKIDGSTSPNKRQEIVQTFQTDPTIKLFVGNIKAAGVGITLTAASIVAFLELPWTPGELVQAIDRVHRITQKEAVMVYYLLSTGTIEEKMAELVDKKMIILEGVLDGKAPEKGSLITELISEYI